MSQNSYNADSIVELKYPDNVRQKIGMFLGSSDINGFNHTFTEILDNSIDEFVAGHGEEIYITVDSKTNKVSIRDYGRGIPYGKNKEGLSSLTLALTKLHAGGKHRKDDGSERTYTYSSGVHGVGASVVQAASDMFNVIVYREKEVARQSFENGIATTDVIISENVDNEKTGTYIEYIPSTKDSEYDKKGVFEHDSHFEKEWLVSKLKYTPYLNNGLKIFLKFDDEDIEFRKEEKLSNILNTPADDIKFLLGEHEEEEEEYSLLVYENGRKKVINIKTKQKEKGYIDSYNSKMRFSFNYAMEQKNTIQLFFVNGVRVKGGKQDVALKTQLKKIVNDYIMENRPSLGGVEIEDILANISFVYSVQLNDPAFSGQTKESLNNPEVSTMATTFVKKIFNEWVLSLQNEEKTLFFKLLEANKKARITSGQIKDNAFKEVMGTSEDEIIKAQGKLKHCSSKDSSLTELYLIEGDSAAGSLEQSRSVKYQALLPLRGKPLNTLKESNRNKILKNKEVISLINAIGVGLGENYDYTKLNYDKIIILADADVDGQHIQALLLAFFYSFYKDLIKEGHVYVAVPPLYKVEKGKNRQWAWNKEELNKIQEESKGNVTRFKGLGEMDPDELFDSTLNPEFRKFIKVKLEDFDSVKEDLEVFMGEEKTAKITLKSIIKEHYKNNYDEKNILKLSRPNEKI